MRTILLASLPALLSIACAVDGPLDHGHDHDADVGLSTEALSSISCAERSDTGYVSGSPFAITVVTVDGRPVERDTANAYYVMAQEASRAGVEIRVVSGFRTMAEQQYFYNCYTSCSCNSCNLAARPGYSNHQSGHALDLNTSSGSVLTWLNANAARFGFRRTVPSEPWHWEWWGGGPGGGPCGRRCDPHCEGSTMVNADCGRGNCAAYGATCVDDSLGLRCASVFCPARGTASVCLNDSTIGSCNDGAISTGDCSAYAAYCSTAGVSQARCVSAFCVASPSEVPRAHDICLPNGQLARCTDTGGVTDARSCPSGTACQSDGAGGFACLRGGASPVGHLDRAGCDEVSGWAQDADDPDAAIRAHVYFDGTPGADGAIGVSLAADVHREDLCDAIGSCAHGYRMRAPYSLFDGADHEVRAYGINIHAGGNQLLAGSPATLRCDPPALEGVLRHITGPESFEAWSFSNLYDVAPHGDEAIAALSEGPALPAMPRLVRADGSEEIFLLDGSARRRVEDVEPWRFTADEIETVEPAAIDAIDEGPPLRARPLIVRRTDGATFLVDELPVPEETGPEPPSEPTEPVEPTEPTEPTEPGRPMTGGGTLTGGCSAAAGESSSAPWLLGLLLAVLLRRRAR